MAVHFHIPGIADTFHLNKLLWMLMEEYPDAFREDTDIGSIYGEFPTSLWNGGRVNGIDTGLACLIAIAKYYNIPADYRQLERAYVLEEGSVDFTTLVRAARDLKLKARSYSGLTETDLDRLVYPILIEMKSGRKIVITTIRDGDIYIMDPIFSQQPVKAERYKLLMDWTGNAILFTRRYEPEKEQSKFGFKWFLPVVTKYAPFLRSVLFVSLILQLLGLAAPFFTQNIIRFFVNLTVLKKYTL